MALNLNPERSSLDHDTRGNFRAVSRHLDFDHYVRWFNPGSFTLTGAAATSATNFPSPSFLWSAVVMPNGDDSNAASSWVKPSEWRSGQLKVYFWYTSPTGSTNNFYVRTGLGAIRDTEVVPGALFSNDFAIAGPAVANTIIRSAALYTSVPFGSDDELFTLRIRRLGAHASDTNTNDMYLVMALVEHIPAAAVSQ